MTRFRVAWHTDGHASKRGGESSKTEYRHFDDRALAEHFVAHVVSPASPEWYKIEPVHVDQEG